MKYDFTSIMDHYGRGTIVVDGLGSRPGFAPDPPRKGFDIIPMWIADMNFPTVPTIPEAVVERAKRPAYGYFDVSDAYYESIIQWREARSGVMDLTRERIGYENGMLGGIVSTLDTFSTLGDAMLLYSPTYIGFVMDIGNCGCKVVHSSLELDENGVWRMDYENMGAKIKASKIHAAVFCSPHNPCGCIWECWELEKVMEVYKSNDCVVILDEVWLDILFDGRKHIPLQSASEDAKYRTVSLHAPPKTLNLVGLIGSCHIIYNKYLRGQIVAQSTKPHYNEVNMTSMHALIGAYKPEGYKWADELCQALNENVNYACEHIVEYFKGVKVSEPEGTYVLFVDCEEWSKEYGKMIGELEKAGWSIGMAWQDGKVFHGPSPIRINLTLPLGCMKETFERMDKYMFNAQKGDSMGRLNEGQNMPDFSFRTPFCLKLTLKEFMAGRGTAIVFPRYSDCMLCQYDMARCAVRYEEIKTAGGKLLVVLQNDPELLAQDLGTEDAMPFTITCDAEGELYREYGILPAESKMKVAGTRTVVKLAKATAAGYKHERYEREGLRLPVAFVMDGKGTITRAHYGTMAGDAPDADKLAGYLKKASC